MKKRSVELVPPFNSPFKRAWRDTLAIETSTCPKCHRDAAFLVWRDGRSLCSVCSAPAGTSGESAGWSGG